MKGLQSVVALGIVHGCVLNSCQPAIVLQVELMRVDIETVSELSAGQTVCDVWHQSSKPKNVSVAQVWGLHTMP